MLTCPLAFSGVTWRLWRCVCLKPIEPALVVDESYTQSLVNRLTVTVPDAAQGIRYHANVNDYRGVLELESLQSVEIRVGFESDSNQIISEAATLILILSYGVLLTRGSAAIVDAVRHWLELSFDASVAPLLVSPWQLSRVTRNLSQSKSDFVRRGRAEFVFAFPTFMQGEGIENVTAQLSMEELASFQRLCEQTSDDILPCIRRALSNATHIDFDQLALTRFGMPAMILGSDGKLKLFVEDLDILASLLDIVTSGEESGIQV